MIPKRIAILGDSWSHGEWSVISDAETAFSKVTHPGLQHFLLNEWPDLEVVNFGIAGGGNLYQLDQLQLVLGSKPATDIFDLIICFWTNPGRDVYNTIKDNTDQFFINYTIEEYEESCMLANKEHHKALEDLNIPVILIGGQVSLPLFPTAKNLIPLVPRMANCVTHPFWDMDNMEEEKGTIDNCIDYEQLTMIPSGKFNDKFKVQLDEKIKQDYCLNYNYFNDLGHGNRKLHRIVADKVIKEVGQWK